MKVKVDRLPSPALKVVLRLWWWDEGGGGIEVRVMRSRLLLLTGGAQ